MPQGSSVARTTMSPALALATFLVVALLIYGLFAGSERQLGSDTRRRIDRYLHAARPSSDDRRGFARGFLEWFDHAFAVRTRRLPLLGEVPLPSFARSVVVTFVSLAFLAIVWLCNKPGAGRAIAFVDELMIPGDQVRRLLLVYGGATIISNWIPDYLSLIESRLILAKMVAARSWSARLGWLLVDAAATLAISFFAIHLAMVVMLPVVTPGWTLEVGCLTPENYSLATTAELFFAGLTFSSPPGTINYDATGIYIYSTFVTSLWVWIYLGSGLLIRGTWVLFGARELRTGHTLRAMALLAITTIGALYWSHWLHRRTTGAEVYIEHGERDVARAEALARALEAEGLWVETRAKVSEDRAAKLLRNAEVVVVLDHAELAWVERELGEQIRCGERSARSASVVSPEVDPAWVLDFAKRAPSLLPMSEVRACREQQGLAVEVDGCAGR
ncbi:MAG: hypothetical protein R6X02_31380 [Enhygromyxa sp.]